MEEHSFIYNKRPYLVIFDHVFTQHSSGLNMTICTEIEESWIKEVTPSLLYPLFKAEAIENINFFKDICVKTYSDEEYREMLEEALIARRKPDSNKLIRELFP
jgi:hypothetical protein